MVCWWFGGFLWFFVKREGGVEKFNGFFVQFVLTLLEKFGEVHKRTD